MIIMIPGLYSDFIVTVASLFVELGVLFLDVPTMIWNNRGKQA